MTTFRPMLSATCEDITKVRLPAMASPKLDGIRCVIRDGKPLTRTLKPIPNRYVRGLLTGLPAFDGELIVGSPVAADVWNVTSSGIMSEDGEPAFAFFVFDLMSEEPRAPFTHRYLRVSELIEAKRLDWLVLVEHIHISNLAELEAYEAKSVELGFEGIMVRSPNGLYKHGRSTMREQGLTKVKRFHDAEAVLVGVVEGQTNFGPATINAFGLTKRSSSKSNKKAAGTLGSLVCELCSGVTRVRFEVGTGFDEATRARIWATQSQWINARVRFKYQSLSPDGVPRFPVFLGRRDERD
jgi:DNA ligase-1